DRIAPLDFPRAVRDVWREVRRRQLTYATPRQLASLIRLCSEAESTKDAGIIIEAGCARGGSAILLCATKSRHRPLVVYDLFDAIPAPSAQDGDDLRRRYEVIA